ncbi:MAG: PQQ-binding-like beta-propeller repeat protein [Gammaproteobacteria bacterium]|nr:PQQ-binding-like beta-propeller repeat protein [Gammaproteobacteria bacterium]
MIRTVSGVICVTFGCAAVLIAAQAIATTAIPNYLSESGVNPTRGYAVDSSGTESIDPMTGVLRLNYTDLVAPGNGGLDIVVQRNYHTSPGAGGGVGQLRYEYQINNGVGWDMHFGRVLSNELACLNDNIDSRQNPVLQLPNGSRQVFFRPIGNPGYDWITKDRWIATCQQYTYTSGSQTYNTAGFSVRSPRGVTYTFSWNDIWLGDSLLNIPDAYVWYPSRIEDRNGNSLDFTYRTKNQHNWPILDRIDGNDGRVVLFEYLDAAGSDARVSRVELAGSLGAGGSQIWDYSYEQLAGSSDYFLVRVDGPDGYRWSYGYYLTGANGDPEIFKMREVTAPYGGRTQYTYQYINRNPLSSLLDVVVGVETKSTYNTTGPLGPILEGVWTYDYYFEDGTPFDYTSVVKPDGSRVVYLHCATKAALTGQLSACSGGEEGALVRREVYPTTTSSSPLQTEDYTWGGQAISYQFDYRPGIELIFQSATSRILLDRTITRDGVAHTTRFLNQDRYDNAEIVVEYAGPTSTAANTRQTNATYFIDTDLWIIKQLANESMLDVFPHPGIQRSFDSNGNLTTLSEYGRTTAFDYYNSGDVREIRDPRGNVTQFSNYYRGIARNENRPQNVNISRTVSVLGHVLSETGGRQLTTGFERDGFGRITNISTPRTDDNDVSVQWSFSNATALGFKGRRLTRGSFIENRVVDGFGRELSVTADGIEKTFAYDALGRKTFESYPHSNEGTAFEYDALDRLTRLVHSVDGSSIEYSYRGEGSDKTAVTVTDELGNVTTNVYHAYGDPEERFLERIDQPESVTTLIERTRRGDVLSIRQGRTGADPDDFVTRRLVYDSRYLVDSESHPEIGSIDVGFDDAGNKTSSFVASINQGTSGTTTFLYDDLNRLESIDFPPSSPDISYTYDANDNLQTVSRGGIVRSYSYDENDNLIGETITIDGQLTYTVSYSFNANDALSRITYPGGLSIEYAPNALGWPTQVGVYASNVNYHSNGALSSMTLAPGVTVSIDQTGRLLTGVISAGSTVNLSYDYDNHANVRAVTNAIEPAKSVSNITYDGIHRLRSATASTFAGRIAFDYDDWANITRRSLGSQVQTFSYQDCLDVLDPGSCVPSFKLENVFNTNREYDYDIYGNATSNGITAFVYDDSSDLVQAGNDTYRYDGHQRRTVITTVAGSRVSLYNKAGQLLFEDDRINNVKTYYIRLGAMLVARHDELCEVGDPDSDSDGIPDCEETFLGFDIDGTADSDGDGATNAEEFAAGSDYYESDTDEDGIPDGYEIDNGLDPASNSDQSADPDNDGLNNLDEFLNDTFARQADSDNDGIPDGYEVGNGLRPRADDADGDLDGDGLENLDEYLFGTRADNPDTDGDNLADGAEVVVHRTDPLEADTDGDEMPDGYEVSFGLQPTVDDADGDLDSDGYSNGHEFSAGSDPGNANDTPAIGAQIWTLGSLSRIAVTSNRVISIERTSPAFGFALRGYRLYGGTLSWERVLDGSVVSDPSVAADDSIYFMTVDNGDLLLHARGAQGEARWSRSLSSAGTVGTPAIDRQGNVYVVANTNSNSGIVRSYDASGQTRWTFESNTARFDTALAIGPDGTVYAGTEAPFSNNPRIYTLYGIDGQTGVQRYVVNFDAGINKGEFGTGIAVSNDGTVYYADGEGRLVALTLTLVEKWRHDAEFVDTIPVVTPDGGAVVSAGCLLQVVNSDGTPRWSRCFNGSLISAAAVGKDGTVYIGSTDGRFHAVNADGSDRWSDPQLLSTQSVVFAPALIDRGVLYANSTFDLQSMRAYTVQPSNVADNQWTMDGFNARRGALAENACGYSDADKDGMPDCVEAAVGGDVTAGGDEDGDGLNNLAEFVGGTAIGNADTDGDGLGDGAEIAAGASPLIADSDGDGLGDNDEVTQDLDPGHPDTDGDIMHDGYEIAEALDPGDPGDGASGQDVDGDGFDNVVEFRYRSRAGDASSFPGSTAAMTLTPVSINLSGTATGDRFSDSPATSGDGRYVVFRSQATDLVPGVTAAVYQVYWRDRESGTTRLVSLAPDGVTPGNFGSGLPSVSDDGRYVAFVSASTNLVASDGNGFNDVFVRDMTLETTVLASHASADPGGADASSLNPQISRNGRFVYFTSRATNIAGDHTDSLEDIFRYDIAAQDNVLVSVSTSSPSSGNGCSFPPAITPDGRYAAFRSVASNLVGGDNNGRDDVFVRDVEAGTTVLVSRNVSDAAPGNNSSLSAVISDDGRYVAFNSLASDLVAEDSNRQQDVFLHDLGSGVTSRISEAPGGVSANSFSFVEDISADGRYVAYTSAATNISSVDSNGNDQDVFRYDRTTGSSELVSVDVEASGSGDDFSSAPQISGDGRYVNFLSQATNLTDDVDRNGFPDVYRRDMLIADTALVSTGLFPNRSGAGANTDFYTSRDAASLAFATRAEDIVLNDANGQESDVVFAGPRIARTQPGAVSLAVNSSSPQTSGAVVTLNAVADGAQGPVEYQFLFKGASTGDMWRLLQDYSTSATMSWNTQGLLGKHRLQVRARSQGTLPETEVRDKLGFWLNDVNPTVDAQLTAAPSSPQIAGMQILLNAFGVGGSGVYEYGFDIKGPATAEEWVELRDYGTQSTFLLDTTGYPGQHKLRVRTRDAGSADKPVKAKLKFWVNDSNPATGASLSATVPNPVATGTVVAVTAAGSGGSEDYDYLFRVKGPATQEIWQDLQTYSSNDTLSLDAANYLGEHKVQVLLRNAGTLDQPVKASMKVWVNGETPTTGATLSVTPEDPQAVGVAVTLSATASGGTGSYEYAYSYKGSSTNGKWTDLRAYTTDPLYNWETAGLLPGKYKLRVEVRNAGTLDQPVKVKTTYILK